MENENMIPEEEVSILTLTDENGADVEFEYLDCIEYQGKEYLILLPVDEEAAEKLDHALFSSAQSLGHPPMIY